MVFYCGDVRGREIRMPYRFEVTAGQKEIFALACTWAETHLPELVEAGRWIDGKVSGMVAAGHEDRPGYLLGAIALSYADSLIGDPGAGFDAMLAAERAAAAKRVILLAWLLIAEDTSAGTKTTPLAAPRGHATRGAGWPIRRPSATEPRPGRNWFRNPPRLSTRSSNPSGSTPHAMRSREVNM